MLMNVRLIRHATTKKWTQISYAIFRTAVPVPDRLLLAKKDTLFVIRKTDFKGALT